jgi:molybdate transport system substrate-binding protein
MASPIRLISSMATRRLLGELVAQFEVSSAQPVTLESVGGVDAARRVRSGEAFDIVLLASDVIDTLMGEGHVLAGSRMDVAVSAVGVAVRAGAARPDIGSAEGVKRAVLSAATLGYSTGPSGTYLASLFERWGIADAVKGRIEVAPPGVPVATLVARGEIELGFQQLSELITADGIDVVGLLPAEIQVLTTFSGGIARTATDQATARQLLTFLASPRGAEVKRRHGMDQPAVA